MYDSHMHTPLCRHAVGEPEQYARAAAERGLHGIIFTCHNPLPEGLSASVRMTPEQFGGYVASITQLRERWRGRLDVRLGLECDYLPGFGLEAWLTEQTRAAEFDYLLGSVHPHLGEYRERYWADDADAYAALYFDHLAATAELGLFDCLAHPDLVKHMLGERWHLEACLPHIRTRLDRIAATGTAMELNTSGWCKSASPECNPGPAILREMRQRDIPVVVGSDAHEPGRVGDRFTDAFDQLEAAGYDEVSYYLERQRHTLPIAAARRTLQAG